jgi:hypothetical protein
MNILKLAAAAALAFATMSVASGPVAAAGASTSAGAATDQRGDWRRDDDRRHHGWRNNRGRHHGWRNNHNRRWATRRVCRTVWRYGHRQRICRIVRYRRYR